MNAVVICKSVHHGNTEKISKVIADAIDARVYDPENINEENLEKYNLIGFVSGIYMERHHRSILDFVDKLKVRKGRNAFIFSTSGFQRIPIIYDIHRQLRKKMIKKGFEIVGEFNCGGWDTYPIFVRPFGGVKKGRPNEKDFDNAKKFADNLIKYKL